MSKLAAATLLLLVPFVDLHAIETDKYAHAGISFAVTTVAYGACKKAFHLGPDESKWGCVLGAAIVSTMLGGIKEATDRAGDKDDMAANFVGNIAAGVTISVFEF